MHTSGVCRLDQLDCTVQGEVKRLASQRLVQLLCFHWTRWLRAPSCGSVGSLGRGACAFTRQGFNLTSDCWAWVSFAAGAALAHQVCEQLLCSCCLLVVVTCTHCTAVLSTHWVLLKFSFAASLLLVGPNVAAAAIVARVVVLHAEGCTHHGHDGTSRAA